MSALDRIPGLAGYLAARQQNEASSLGQLQQAQGVMGLQGALRAREQEEQLMAALAQSNGDPEKAMQIAIASGNLAGAAKLAPVVEARRKQGAGQPIGSGGLRLPNGEIVPPAAGPKQFAPPEIIRLQEHLKTLPEGDPRRVPVEKRIQMLGERQPAVQVNMPGSSDTVQGPDGKFYKFRIGKDGKTEVVPLQTPGGEPLRPPRTAAEIKDALEKSQTTADLGEIERLGAELNTLVQQNQGLFKGVVGPQGYIGRIVDLAAGSAGADTPAIDFANKSKLFLSSVRKVVEKDPNLSNQERQSLLESIGVGFWQTGPSSIRARNDVMQYVKNKRMGGLKDSGPKRISSDADYDALPSGAEFIAPDGTRRKKP